MQKLNFPTYSFRFKSTKNKLAIFDPIRKKFVVLTPEEWVRQHVIMYLLEKQYSLNYLSAEKQFLLNGLVKRYDVVAYKPSGMLHLLVECKAPEIAINQQTFDQIARYNLSLRADYLMVTNGLKHYFCQMDFENETYRFLTDLPEFSI